ncbi:UpxY family transcription antiterminator [Flavobacterium sp.]|uniref:UpxY family transcription antiterminator n=1 Tax=Flavobacterium sp. TaxID=239 RepID=UPI0035B4E199
MNWYVLYTKPRYEKKVAQRLSQLGISNYCPLVKEVKQWSDRKKKVERPLLPSYVFVYLSEHQRDLVFQVAGVVCYVFWLGKPAVISDKEVQDLKYRLSDTFQKVSIGSLEKGSIITLESGVFKGQSAVVDEVSRNKIRVNLISLGVFLILEKAI